MHKTRLGGCRPAFRNKGDRIFPFPCLGETWRNQLGVESRRAISSKAAGNPAGSVPASTVYIEGNVHVSFWKINIPSVLPELSSPSLRKRRPSKGIEDEKWPSRKCGARLAGPVAPRPFRTALGMLSGEDPDLSIRRGELPERRAA